MRLLTLHDGYMTQIPFTKMHGLGNNYVYFDTFKHDLKEHSLPQLAQSVSNIHTGIGSDGIILMGPSERASLKMRIFNKDGSEAKNCGNGLRCVAKLAYDAGYVKTKTFSIETLGGIVEATIESSSAHQAMVSIDMGIPRLLRSEIPMLGSPHERVIGEPFNVAGHHLHLTAVSMGNPHAVFFVPQISESLHMSLGPIIEKDARFPERINVEFVEVVSPSEMICRVWERGSGVTQACGTGACAVVVAAILNQYLQKQTRISVHLEGGVLEIEWLSNDHIRMTGPAETIASGVWLR